MLALNISRPRLLLQRETQEAEVLCFPNLRRHERTSSSLWSRAERVNVKANTLCLFLKKSKKFCCGCLLIIRADVIFASKILLNTTKAYQSQPKPTKLWCTCLAVLFYCILTKQKLSKTRHANPNKSSHDPRSTKTPVNQAGSCSGSCKVT